jgi:molybdopterin converting factor small subunit
MSIRVEFFGIPRERAGVALAEAQGARLGDVLLDLADQFPKWAEACLDERQLRPGFVANLAGQEFVTDAETAIADGDTLLILSADAGG